VYYQLIFSVSSQMYSSVHHYNMPHYNIQFYSITNWYIHEVLVQRKLRILMTTNLPQAVLLV